MDNPPTSETIGTDSTALRRVDRNAADQEIVYLPAGAFNPYSMANTYALVAGLPEPYEIRWLDEPKNVTPPR